MSKPKPIVLNPTYVGFLADGSTKETWDLVELNKWAIRQNSPTLVLRRTFLDGSQAVRVSYRYEMIKERMVRVQ